MAFPNDFFGPPAVRDHTWPDHPNLRRMVEWLKTFMTPEEWQARREAAATRLYDAALGKINPLDEGRFFSENDLFGWYLFLGDAYLDHIWNYEPTFGSRVIPILMSLGQDFDLLRGIDGLQTRVRRLVGSEKRQPNGGLFELLVAAAYLRAGARVSFIEERPGGPKTHDMDVELDGHLLAIECKRMETGEYGEFERGRMRDLWRESSFAFAQLERSVFCDVHFRVPLEEVPDDYLDRHAQHWARSGLPSELWNDAIAYGVIGDLDLQPLQSVLVENQVIAASSRMHELLIGRYRRHANILHLLRSKLGDNPRYVDECDLAIVLRWEANCEASVDKKARDVFRKLVEANDQLPDGRPAIIHVGFEAVEGDQVERARYEKILASARRFDPGTKQLQYIYCHYFVPESPPDQSWAYDETTQWFGLRPSGAQPLKDIFLVLPKNADGRVGPHWQS